MCINMTMITKNSYKNILVFNPAFLGDTILTTPLIKALHILYPYADISFCIRPEHTGLFEGLSYIKQVIPFDKRNSQKGISGLMRFAKDISNYQFDLVVNLHLSLRSTTLFSFVKNTHIVGFSSAVMSYLFNARVEKKQELCEVERNLMLLSALCDNFSLEEAKKIGGSLETYIDETFYSNTSLYFKSVSQNKKIIAVAPGSVWATKRYPLDYFILACESLYEHGYAIALFGGKDDSEALNKFAENFKYPYFDFALKTPLCELPAILKACDLLLVNDSGAMHIAVSAGIPCVAVFGPTVKSLGFFPYDNISVVIENTSLTCRPCGKHGGNTCPKGHFKCMVDIPPSHLVDAALSILAGKDR